MYWSDWGSHPKLERAWLDGTHREVLVNTSIQWPNGLALDYTERKLYWADAKLDKIEVCNLNGSDRRVVLNKEVPHIYGFGLIGKHLYWTDWQRRNLQKIHVDSSQNKDIIAELLPAVMGLKVVNMKLKYGMYTTYSSLDLFWAIDCGSGTSANYKHSTCLHVFNMCARHSICVHVCTFYPRFDLEYVNPYLIRFSLGANGCQKNNGNCSHLCLYTPVGVQCECPMGLELTKNNKTCVGKYCIICPYIC